MQQPLSVRLGCLMGLAAGDAMGTAVEQKTLAQIREALGPEGLRGYELVDGYALTGSHTQVAAFVSNGLLVGITRSRDTGKAAPLSRYINLGLTDWARTQQYTYHGQRQACWVSQLQTLRRRCCRDSRLLDVLSREGRGTPEAPINSLNTPGSLVSAIAVGLFFRPERMDIPEIGQLGAQALALTHGDSMTFLSGAVLSYIIAGILQDRKTKLKDHFRFAADAVLAQFGKTHPQAATLHLQLLQAMELATQGNLEAADAMEQLGCATAPQVLAGAMYACLAGKEDFEDSLIIAVNHSGHSAAVGAVTGAILGSLLGIRAIPEFYLDCLAPTAALYQLCEDLITGCPVGVFDDDWERKYIHGEPVEKDGWRLE